MFKSWKTEPVQWIVLRVVVGAAWIYIGAEKLLRIQEFRDSVANYEIVTEPWNTMIAYMVPWVEIIVGCAILLRFMYMGALLLQGCMLCVFIIALSQAWARGLEISCGCTPWAAEEKTNYLLGIGINVTWLLVTAVMTYAEVTRPRHRFRGRKLKLS